MYAHPGKLTSAPASPTQSAIAIPALFAAPLSARARLVRPPPEVPQKVQHR